MLNLLKESVGLFSLNSSRPILLNIRGKQNLKIHLILNEFFGGSWYYVIDFTVNPFYTCSLRLILNHMYVAFLNHWDQQWTRINQPLLVHQKKTSLSPSSGSKSECESDCNMSCNRSRSSQQSNVIFWLTYYFFILLTLFYRWRHGLLAN